MLALGERAPVQDAKNRANTDPTKAFATEAAYILGLESQVSLALAGRLSDTSAQRAVNPATLYSGAPLTQIPNALPHLQLRKKRRPR